MMVILRIGHPLVANPRKFESDPGFLSFLRQSIPSVTERVTLTSTFADPVTVTVEDATVDAASTDFGGGSGEFSNLSGQLTIPHNGSVSFPVTFTGKSCLPPGSVSGSLRVRSDSGPDTIELLGRLSGQVAPH